MNLGCYAREAGLTERVAIAGTRRVYPHLWCCQRGRFSTNKWEILYDKFVVIVMMKCINVFMTGKI